MKRLLLLAMSAQLVACAEPGTTAPTESPAISFSFDEFGYNDVAGIFSGPADGVDRILDGMVWGDATYANDDLVMKWNNEWDRGNDEGWSNPPYKAWTTNEWNGQVPGGSGEVWHYMFKWVGPCGAYGNELPDGGYCIWDQFEVIFSVGSFANQHSWDAHAKAAGLGN